MLIALKSRKGYAPVERLYFEFWWNFRKKWDGGLDLARKGEPLVHSSVCQISPPSVQRVAPEGRKPSKSASK